MALRMITDQTTSNCRVVLGDIGLLRSRSLPMNVRVLKGQTIVGIFDRIEVSSRGLLVGFRTQSLTESPMLRCLSRSGSAFKEPRPDRGLDI